MTLRFPLALLMLGLVGCQSPTAPATAAKGWGGPLSPQDVIAGAAANPQAGITGVFELDVRNTGSVTRIGGTTVYLNSDPDYRSERCLTIALVPEVLAAAPTSWGGNPERFFRDSRIRVTGTARLVRIDLLKAGVPSGEFYYQVHVVVSDLNQIELLGPATSAP